MEVKGQTDGGRCRESMVNVMVRECVGVEERGGGGGVWDGDTVPFVTLMSFDSRGSGALDVRGAQ